MWKEGKFWIVEIPALDLLTQGLSKAEAYHLAGSVVEDVIGKSEFKVSVRHSCKDRFVLEANDSLEMIALLLRRQRMKKGVSVREASRLMGATSPNAWGACKVEGDR